VRFCHGEEVDATASRRQFGGKQSDEQPNFAANGFESALTPRTASDSHFFAPKNAAPSDSRQQRWLAAFVPGLSLGDRTLRALLFAP
jgi:hypothetical protein